VRVSLEEFANAMQQAFPQEAEIVHLRLHNAKLQEAVEAGRRAMLASVRSNEAKDAS
jgi:hypothetical protein